MIFLFQLNDNYEWIKHDLKLNKVEQNVAV
jgi:hypothetical protein